MPKKSFEVAAIGLVPEAPVRNRTAEQLLAPAQLAERLKVPVSWVYSRTRVKKGKDTIPMLRVGKYCRFIESEVLQWLESQQASKS